MQNVKKPQVVNRLNSVKRATKPMNFMLFMLDTVSRAQFFRKMKHLSGFLEELNSSSDYEVFQFFRVLTNGFSTDYNTRAMYSGSLLMQNRSGKPYWDLFKSQGNVALYLNGFCEDWEYKFLRKEQSLADHTVFLPWCHPEYHPFEKTFGNFAGPFSIKTRCLNGRRVHEYFFNYLREYFKNYKDWGKVSHLAFQEGHEGTGEVILTLDTDFTNFLRELKDSGELNNTVVVITSDHGSHMGPYFMVGEIGEFEQRLPMLFMTFPSWFTEKYPQFREKLLENEQKLVTHYDTYWTVRHLASLPEFGGTLNNSEDFEHVWDCQKNLFHMKSVLTLKDKFWRRGQNRGFTNEITQKIRHCLKELQESQEPLANITTVPLELIRDRYEENPSKPSVVSVLKDKNTWAWQEDAYESIAKESLLGVSHDHNKQEILTKEKESLNAFKAPGKGRYLFGRSLMKYSEDRKCSQAGAPKCICNQKDSERKFLWFNEDLS